MPLIKSAKKRVRVAGRKAQVNILHRSGSKSATRTATRAITSGADNAASLVVQAASKLDRAAAKGAIHPNKAARLKSRLSLKLNAAGKTEPKAAKKARPTAKKAATKKPAAKKTTTKKAAK